MSVLQCNRTENAMHPVLQYVMHSCIRALANDDADDADDADDVDDGDGDGDDDAWMMLMNGGFHACGPMRQTNAMWNG